MENNSHTINSGTWIDYAKSSELLNKLEDLLDYPKVLRMPNILIVGDTNNGKTEIISRFAKKHPSYAVRGEDHFRAPVVLIEAKGFWDAKALCNSILTKLRVLHKPNDNISYKFQQTLNALSNVQCRVLIIDELNQLLGTQVKKQYETLSALKSITNELQISIVAAGTKPAQRVIASIPDIENRFLPFNLERWKMTKEFAQLVLTFVKDFSLKPNEVTIDKMFVQYILDQSEGLLGEVATLLKTAAIEASENKESYITLDRLKNVQWVKPSQRRSIIA